MLPALTSMLKQPRPPAPTHSLTPNLCHESASIHPSSGQHVHTIICTLSLTEHLSLSCPHPSPPCIIVFEWWSQQFALCVWQKKVCEMCLWWFQWAYVLLMELVEDALRHWSQTMMCDLVSVQVVRPKCFGWSKFKLDNRQRFPIGQWIWKFLKFQPWEKEKGLYFMGLSIRASSPVDRIDVHVMFKMACERNTAHVCTHIFICVWSNTAHSKTRRPPLQLPQKCLPLVALSLSRTSFFFLQMQCKKQWCPQCTTKNTVEECRAGRWSQQHRCVPAISVFVEEAYEWYVSH